MAILVLSSSWGMWSRFSRMFLVAVAIMPKTGAMSKKKNRKRIVSKVKQVTRLDGPPYD